MDQDRPRQRVGKDFDPHEILSQVTILHHTDTLLARKVTKAVLLKRAERGDFRDPIYKKLPIENGVIHVEV